MEQVHFRNLDNSQIWDKIVDKKLNHILLHQFCPHNTIEWWNTSIEINMEFKLKNVLVRQVRFDLYTDLSTLKNILSLNTLYLSIYQFSKSIPDTMILESLPEDSKESILRQNGLEHIIQNELEDTVVSSYSKEFIDNIRSDSQVGSKILL